jgi:predicted ATPase
MGKTRLAQEVMRLWRERHPEGVVWVDLAAFDAPSQVTPAIASACGAQLQSGEPREQLARALCGRGLLLVLDNCEHLVEETARCARALLERCPDLRVLATTQVLLRITGEYAYRLQGLAVPAALSLLEHRARTADSRFQLGDENVRHAMALCEALDGSPLALEMAAARIPALGIPALMQRLDQRGVLKATGRDVPERQRTLVATLEWSHGLLSPKERAVLHRLSVFVGTFRLESAIVVAIAGDEDEFDVLDAISTLVDKSLVQTERVDALRYRLLETMQRFASDQLDASGEREAAELRHGTAMQELVAEAEASTWHLSDPDWVAAYLSDYPDLEAALHRACARRDAETAAAAGEVLTRLDFMRDTEFGAYERLSALHPLLPVASPLARARILNCLCRFADVTLPGLDRVEISAQRVEAWKQLGKLPTAHNILAFWHAPELLAAGRFDEAMAALQEARSMGDSSWPARTRVMRLVGETQALFFRFDEAKAREGCRRLIALFEQDGLSIGAIRVRGWLARLVFVTEKEDEALRLLEDSMQELQAQHPAHYRMILATFAAAKARSGDLEAARTLALRWIEEMWPRASTFPSEHVAFVLAKIGEARAASHVLGLGDAYLAQHKRVRMAPEARSADEAAALIEGSLGREAMEVLRNEGAALPRHTCLGFARIALASRAI